MPRLANRLAGHRLRRTAGAAACVREPARFVLNELRGRPTISSYRLRESGLAVAIRHPLLDMWVLEEVFRFKVYEPPESVRPGLAGLQTGGRIVDLGGHIGCFGLFMHHRFPHAELVSFEPDPSNAEILRRCVDDNHLDGRWEVIEACAATADGTARFSSSYHLSRISSPADPALGDLQRSLGRTFPFLQGSAMLTPQHRQVACRDVFPYLDGADLVKIDIEGAEWDLLDDERLGAIHAAVLVLEYHPMYTPDPDPDATVLAALQRAGYAMCARERSPDATLVWARASE